MAWEFHSFIDSQLQGQYDKGKDSWLGFGDLNQDNLSVQVKGLGHLSRIISLSFSEHDEGLSNVTFNSFLFNTNYIETNSLWERSALADSDNISNTSTCESWWQVSWEIVMTFLESVVLLNVMKIISTKDHSTSHLIGKYDTFENTSTNRNIRGERAFVINVWCCDGSLGSLETFKNNIS